ncbi:hypothetical protein A8H39_05325 [Paraburkholderia fungorum]|jgi:hypothetical protein|uniref:hypothetical protein n=1 Tax=Paraburkholderia fungorum TaxID=134537 RepID=UPI0004888429|nr:hypothetical protein [Paraburkholderia fungorum]MBB5542837.1 hypothetical protein [Paraburkholderia fungorum]PNE55323.1 hypothetical protein A8H39_05325 [Paraburkholderia fungorum]
MERTLITLTGSTQATLIDQDIAHIGRVMRPSLLGDLGGPILPAAYWRKRLHQLLDAGQLSHAQLCGVDSLLLQLDQFEASAQPALDELPPTTAMPLRPVHAVTAYPHI